MQLLSDSMEIALTYYTPQWSIEKGEHWVITSLHL